MQERPVKPYNTPLATIHTSRTLMFEELCKVMEFGLATDAFQDSLEQNIISKATQSNRAKTSNFLRKLYSFSLDDPGFRAFRFFWQMADEPDKPLLTLVFAMSRDYLLEESARIVLTTPVGEKVKVADLEENIENLHPGKYSANTRRSVAQNLASSWKQAGYIMGKVKSIRSRANPGYLALAFAMFLEYLHGNRGDYILTGKWVQALDLPESTVRAFAFEAAKRDLLNYQYSGGVTSLSFPTLHKKLKIDVHHY